MWPAKLIFTRMKVPREVEARVAATTSVRDLQKWIDNVLDAEMLADIGIPTD